MSVQVSSDFFFLLEKLKIYTFTFQINSLSALGKQQERVLKAVVIAYCNHELSLQ